MEKKTYYKSLGLILATGSWFAGALVHLLVYGELQFQLIPHDPDKLWMRSAIFLLLIGLGMYADYHTREMVRKEREKLEVYKSTVQASHHILNNYLNQMHLFRLKAEDCPDFDPDLLVLYEKVSEEARDLVSRLGSVEEMTHTAITGSVYPSAERGA